MRSLRSTNNYRRQGFTLLELVAVVWCLGICLLIGTALIAATVKSNQAGIRAANRVSQREEGAAAFRRDVASAESTLDKIGDFTNGPECLILKLSSGPVVIYRIENSQVERIERNGDSELKRAVEIGTREGKLEFLKPSAKLVTLRINEATSSSRVSEISACLGGDLR